MVGKLLYTNPTVKYFDLALYAEEAIAKFGGLSSMTALDSVVLAAFQVWFGIRIRSTLFVSNNLPISTIICQKQMSIINQVFED